MDELVAALEIRRVTGWAQRVEPSPGTTIWRYEPGGWSESGRPRAPEAGEAGMYLGGGMVLVVVRPAG